MLFIPPCAQALRAVKKAVSDYLPEASSSQLTEALAAAAGFNTNSALRVSLWRPGADASLLRAFEFDDVRFTTRLNEFGLSAAGWPGFQSLATDSWVTTATYNTPRKMVARNLMVAGVLSGLAQGLFTLEEDGNLWPGAIANAFRTGTYFHVWMPEGIPALGWLSAIGYGELSINVACWPRGDSVAASNAGFHAGEAVASGWLERQNGKWIMEDHRGGITVNVRRHLQPLLAGAIAPTVGFADQGKFFF